MSFDPGAAGVIADLQGRLDAAADPATKTWFENYLKHAIGYRGVKTPVVTRIVAEWRGEHGLERLPDDDQLALARSLIEGRLAEDKLERHFDDLSAEVIRRHTRYLADHERYKERKRRGAIR